MANNFFKIKRGQNLEPTTGSTVTAKGDVAYNSSTDKLELYNGAADPMVQESKAATVINKTINGPDNTLTNIADTSLSTISTAGKVSNSATTATSANTASAIVARDGSGDFAAGTITAALTGSVTGTASGNTTISGQTNHGVVVASATNAMTSTAAGTAGQPLLSGGAGADPAYGTLGVANGGTGQTTALAGFNALSPLTTTGDLLTYSGGNNVRLGIGSANQILTVSGGAPIWANSSQNLAVTSKTTTYTATTADDVILVSAASSWTLTLFTAAGNTGKVLRIVRTDNDITTAVTIDGAGAETIRGAATVKLNTQWESWTIVSDGTNWQVIEHKSETPWSSASFTFNGIGTVANNVGFFRRQGDTMYAHGTVQAGTVAGTQFSLQLPSGITIDTAKFSSITNGNRVGIISDLQQGASVDIWNAGPFTNYMFYDGGTATNIYAGFKVGASQFTAANGSNIFSNNDYINYEFYIPVSGWDF